MFDQIMHAPFGHKCGHINSSIVVLLDNYCSIDILN